VSELQLTTRFTIHAGRLDEFKGLASRCMEIVREKDSGNLGDLMGRFLSVSDPDIEIYGAPADALLGALAALRPRVFSAYQSL